LFDCILQDRLILIKVNGIHNNGKVINATKLDIDDYGSVIPLEELRLKLPSNDDSIVKILRISQYAVLSDIPTRIAMADGR
jgi:hypothetical protein